jgi:mono/diheme cytochrome c family protein
MEASVSQEPQHVRRGTTAAVYVLAAALVAGIMACGGGEQPASGDSAPAAAAPPPAAADAGFDPATITPAMLALGDSVFHGLAGMGTCVSCHGPDATGPTGVAPNLKDAEWLHSDGSWEGIFKTVQSGVMAPKKHSSVMLPMGGAALSPEHLRAVTAYVYSLSHKVGG